MKSSIYTIVRAIGIAGAIWIIYLLVNGHIQLHQQTKDISSASPGFSIGLKYFLTATLPFSFLAALLVLPYSRMKKWLRYGCISLMIIFAGLFLIHLFGPYFLSARFLPGIVPPNIWISATVILGFFVLQIAAIVFQNDNRITGKSQYA